jgi:hypothetical protein
VWRVEISTLHKKCSFGAMRCSKTLLSRNAVVERQIFPLMHIIQLLQCDDISTVSPFAALSVMNLLGRPKRTVVMLNLDSLSGQLFSSLPDAYNIRYGLNEILDSLAVFAGGLKGGIKHQHGINFNHVFRISKQQHFLLTALHTWPVNI